MYQIPKLNKKELRNFGLLIGTIIALLFGLVLPWIRNHSLPILPWIIAAVFWILAILAPTALKPIYPVWMRIGFILGWVKTRILLGIVFYALVWPMGLIMRLLNRDPMTRKFDAELKTYRLQSPTKTRASMEKPF